MLLMECGSTRYNQVMSQWRLMLMATLPCEIVIPTTRTQKPEGKYYQSPRSAFIERSFVEYCTFDLE
ncbi:unnamed protein product [Penicillium camemberti]|uniref:Str. FM013 n=1 Tax=Penicillium camemberti (strain FM 013) TaxID=1429867 RepID=A0A0G4NYR7_PENC3|nr:unnamed protein product [Penicillium camemberti]